MRHNLKEIELKKEFSYFSVRSFYDILREVIVFKYLFRHFEKLSKLIVVLIHIMLLK